MTDDYYENMIEDENGISWPGGMRGMFEGKELGFCGCANDEITDDVINIFKEFYQDKKTYYAYYTKIAEKLKLDVKYVELILYLLDGKGWLEHGTSIRGSWLTEEGIAIGDKYGEVFE